MASVFASALGMYAHLRSDLSVMYIYYHKLYSSVQYRAVREIKSIEQIRNTNCRLHQSINAVLLPVVSGQG